MPYCQECGSHYDQDIGVCSSCGNKATAIEEINVSSPPSDIQTNPPPEIGNIESVILNGLGDMEGDNITSLQNKNLKEPDLVEITETINNPVFKESPSEVIHQEGLSLGSHRNQVESHLGKGLIKPVVIENCMDGFHFKYDEPPRQINKSEPQKEKVVEFRVSGETESSNKNQLIEEVKAEQEEVKTLTENLESLIIDSKKDENAFLVMENDEANSEPESNPKEPGGDEPYCKDEPNFNEKDNLLEAGLNAEKVNLEPEIHTDIIPEILWEGQRTWNWLTLRETYQITNISVTLLNGYGVKVKEIEWQSVSGIILKQNWLSKLLNIGNLEVIGLNSEPLLTLEGIENPGQLRKMLVEILDFRV